MTASFAGMRPVSVPRPPKRSRKPFYTSVTTEVDVDVDIDPESLEAEGWHHKDDCPAERGISGPVTDFREVVASLHRQAHPSQHPRPDMCREEPCRSLPVDALWSP